MAPIQSIAQEAAPYAPTAAQPPHGFVSDGPPAAHKLPTEVIQEILTVGVTTLKGYSRSAALLKMGQIDQGSRKLAERLKPAGRSEVALVTKAAEAISTQAIDFFQRTYKNASSSAEQLNALDYPLSDSDKKTLSSASYLTLKLLDKSLGSYFSSDMTYAYNKTLQMLHSNAPQAYGLIIKSGRVAQATPAFPNVDLKLFRDFESIIIENVDLSILDNAELNLREMKNLIKIKLVRVNLYSCWPGSLANLGLESLPKLKNLVYLDYYLRQDILPHLKLQNLAMVKTLSLGITTYSKEDVFDIEQALLSMPSLKVAKLSDTRERKAVLNQFFENNDKVQRNHNTFTFAPAGQQNVTLSKS